MRVDEINERSVLLARQISALPLLLNKFKTTKHSFGYRWFRWTGKCFETATSHMQTDVGNLKKPMNIKIVVIIISCLTFTACRQSEKSKETMKQAMDVYLFSELNDDIKIDSSLRLTNKALEFDDQNFNALNHKATLLFRKKDSKGLIQVADRLIELTDKPFYLGQKAIYLEFEGEIDEANEYYSGAIEKYDDYLKTDSLNFDLLLEYVGILEASNDTTKANKILTDMKEMDFEDYQIEMIDLYKEQAVSKKQLIKYWTGEIEYEQIGGK